MKLSGLVSSSLGLFSTGVFGDIQVSFDGVDGYAFVQHGDTYEIKGQVIYNPEEADDEPVVTLDGSVNGGEDHKYFKIRPNQEPTQYDLG